MTALSKVIGVLLLVGSATAPPPSNKEGILTEEGGAKNAEELGKAEHRGGPMLKPAPYVPPDPLPAQYARTAICALFSLGALFYPRGRGRGGGVLAGVLSLLLCVFRRNQTCATITGASNNKDRCGCTEGLRIGLLPGPAQIPISDTKNFRQIIAEARVASIGDCNL